MPWHGQPRWACGCAHLHHEDEGLSARRRPRSSGSLSTELGCTLTGLVAKEGAEAARLLVTITQDFHESHKKILLAWPRRPHRAMARQHMLPAKQSCAADERQWRTACFRPSWHEGGEGQHTPGSATVDELFLKLQGFESSGFAAYELTVPPTSPNLRPIAEAGAVQSHGPKSRSKVDPS